MDDNTKARKICFITGSRADYGLLLPLMKLSQCQKNIQTQIIAMGTHMLNKYNNTQKEFDADGLYINVHIHMDLCNDNEVTIVNAVGMEMTQLSNAFEKLKPDIIVLLGDRYEIAAAAFVATLFKLPIAHLCGGDITMGSYDENFRHSLTKMSHLHFPSNSLSAKRIQQMGEDPTRIYNFGNPGLEEIHNFVPLCKDNLDIKLFKTNYVVIYHPTTLHDEKTNKFEIQQVLTALSAVLASHNDIKKDLDLGLHIIGTNADNHNNVITEEIEKFVKLHETSVKYYLSLSRYTFLSLLFYSDLLIGNSSAGIYEAPLLKKMVINIGERQKGRSKPNAVIDCVPHKDDILNAIHRCNTLASDSNFKIVQIYESHNSSERIMDVLMNCDLTPELLKKEFYSTI